MDMAPPRTKDTKPEARINQEVKVVPESDRAKRYAQYSLEGMRLAKHWFSSFGNQNWGLQFQRFLSSIQWTGTKCGSSIQI